MTDPTALEDLVLAAFVLGGLLVTAAAILEDVRAQARAGAATSQGGALRSVLIRRSPSVA